MSERVSTQRSENEVEQAHRPTVVVTGFGLFRNHCVNSSWLTVQELVKLDIKDIAFVAKEIPVDYEAVARIVPELWETYKPNLMVHCGMSDKARFLTVEKIAYNNSYIMPDIQGKLPQNNICCSNGPDSLCTVLDVPQVVDHVNKTSATITYDVSDDAGRYLCEFIYYSSLRINRNTIFVHIPLVDQHRSAQEMASSLLLLIRSFLSQCEPCSS